MYLDNWLQIFDLCPQVECFRSVSLVNKEFNIIAEKITFKKINALKYSNLTYQYLAKLEVKNIVIDCFEQIDIFSHVQKLTCHASPNVSFANLTNLTKLNFQYSDIQDESISMLISLESLSTNDKVTSKCLKELTNLTFLTWNDGRIVDDSFSNLTNLCVLSIDDNYGPELNNLIISNLTNLEYLNISMQEQSYMNYNGIKNLTKLDYLSGDFDKIDLVNLEYLHNSSEFEGLSNLTNLNELSIIINNSDQDFKYLTNLEILDIFSNDLVFDEILKLTKITDLKLDGDIIADLNKMTNLTKLNIEDCSYNNRIDKLVNLKKLVVSDYYYNEDIKLLTNLTTLDLRNNGQITNDGIFHLTNLINIKVSDDSGVYDGGMDFSKL